MSERRSTGALAQPPDAADRDRAANDFDTNLVVIAGAGTGKTSLLVERLLVAVGSGRAEIDALAAITFTDKAAAEMRLRAATGLEELRSLAEGDTLEGSPAATRAFGALTSVHGIAPAEIGRRSLAALQQLDRARIVTIHGFCSELLRAHPVEAGVDPDFVVDRGERAQLLSRSAWQAFLAGELGPDAPRAALWRATLAKLRLETLQEIALRLAHFDVPHELLELPEGTRATETLFTARATEIFDALDDVRVSGQALTPTFGAALPLFVTALRRLAVGGVAECQHDMAAQPALVELLSKSFASPSKKNDAATRELQRERFERAKELLKLVARIDEATADAVTELLAPFAREFRESLLARGLMSFDGLLVLARDLLRDHPEVRREIKQRYRLLFVDEFQDTDPLQYEIVLYLAERQESSARDPFTAPLIPGKLFIVGDPKQSIYRFRGADYSAFHRAIDRVLDEGGAQLLLTANFRSTDGVIGPVNRLFATGPDSPWVESAVQPRYDPIAAMRAGDDSVPAVELVTLDLAPTTRAEARRHAEGLWIAQLIEQAMASGRVAGYGSIALLFRRLGSVAHYLRALRERRIPFVVDGGRDFIDRPEIRQSLAVLHAVARPTDPTAILAFLRSPAGGVPDTDLAAWTATGGRLGTEDRPDPTRFALLARRLTLLDELRAEVSGLAVDRAVRHILERADVLPLAAAAYEGAQRVANLTKLALAAGSLAREARLSLADLIEIVAQGGLAELEADSPLADEATDAVRITSIHKMKGLESDWVILPDLAREQRAPNPSFPQLNLTRLPGGSAALALAVDKRSWNAAWVHHTLEHAAHERAEELRVFYVALTRARDRLILLAGKPRGKSSWIDALGAWGYDAAEAPADGVLLDGGHVAHWRGQVVETGSQTEDRESTRHPAQVAAYEAAVATLRRSTGLILRAPSRATETAGPGSAWESRQPSPRRHGNADQAISLAVGSVVHRLLEGWDGLDPAWLSQRTPLLCAEHADAGIDPKALEAAVQVVLHGFLNSELARRFSRIERVARELPLLFTDDGPDGIIYRGTIDLVYRDEDGRLVVADYKTDHPADAATLRERYAAQLGVYTRALAEALKLSQPPRAELWLLRPGTILEI